MQNNKIINIYGPTITKKTGLAVFAAKYIWGKYNIEPVLINADSRKVYADLDVGQVKIAPPWDKKLPVKMNKFVALNKRYYLYDYKKDCEEVIDKALSEGKMPIMFGGTGIYHLSIIENWNVPRKGQSDKDFVDFKYATFNKHPQSNKVRRGTSYKAYQKRPPKTQHTTPYKELYGKDEPKYESLILMPFMPKDVLFGAVNGHIEGHFKSGLYKEVKNLVQKYNLNLLDITQSDWNIMFETIGYKEFLEYSIKNNILVKDFNTRELNHIKKNMYASLKDMVRKQIRFSDNFADYKIVDKFEKSREFIDEFMSRITENPSEDSM